MAQQTVEVRPPGGSFTEIQARQYEVTLGTQQTHVVPTATVTAAGTTDATAGDDIRIATDGRIVFQGQIRKATYGERGQKRITAKHPAADLFSESVSLPTQTLTPENHLLIALAAATGGSEFTLTVPVSSETVQYGAETERNLRAVFRDVADLAEKVFHVRPVAKEILLVSEGSGGSWRAIDTDAGDGVIRRWSDGNIDTVRNAVTVIGTGGIATQAVAENSQSISTYGRRTGNSPYKYRGVTSQAAAQAAAESLLRPEPLPSGTVVIPEDSTTPSIYAPRINQTVTLTDELRDLNSQTLTVTKQVIQPGRTEVTLGPGGEAYATDETTRSERSGQDTTRPGSVYDTPRLADGAVTNDVLGAGAVDTDNLKPGATTDAKIADLAISTAKIQDRAIANGKLESDAVGTDKIQAFSVESSKISAGAVTSGELADLSVSESKVTDEAITTPKVKAEAIEAGLIASNAVVSAKIAAEAVSTNELAANAITADKIEAGAVDTTSLAADGVIAGKISAGAVGADEIAANSITANQIDVLDLDAGDFSVSDGNGNSIQTDLDTNSITPNLLSFYPTVPAGPPTTRATVGRANDGEYWDVGFINELIPDPDASTDFRNVGLDTARYSNAYFQDMDIKPQNAAGNGIDITTASGAIAFDEQAILPQTDGFGILGSGDGSNSSKAWKEIHTNNLYEYSPEPLDSSEVELDELVESSWREPPAYASQGEKADGTYTRLPERGSGTEPTATATTDGSDTPEEKGERGRGVELGHMTNYLRAALAAEVERRRALEETVTELRDRLNQVESELGI